MWYVYILYDPRNEKPFYVGKGKKYRMSATVNIRQTGNSLKRKFLKEIELLGLEPKLKIVGEYLQELDALEHEKTLIKEFGRIIKGDGILTNYSEGGDKSNSGWIPSKDTKELWSTQRSGVKQTKEHIQKRVEKTKGKTRSQQQKHNCTLASIRRTNPQLKLKIIELLEATPYKHGMYKDLAKKLNCHHELISRIHKDIDLYKKALNEWNKK